MHTEHARTKPVRGLVHSFMSRTMNQLQDRLSQAGGWRDVHTPLLENQAITTVHAASLAPQLIALRNWDSRVPINLLPHVVKEGEIEAWTVPTTPLVPHRSTTAHPPPHSGARLVLHDEIEAQKLAYPLMLRHCHKTLVEEEVHAPVTPVLRAWSEMPGASRAPVSAEHSISSSTSSSSS